MHKAPDMRNTSNEHSNITSQGSTVSADPRLPFHMQRSVEYVAGCQPQHHRSAAMVRGMSCRRGCLKETAGGPWTFRLDSDRDMLSLGLMEVW
jgi:hypothetical protein